VVAVCAVAYVAGVLVMVGTAPIVYTAAFTVLPRHHTVLGSQSASRDMLPAPSADESIKHAANIVSLEPASAPSGSFLIHLFHMLTFTDTVTSFTLFPAFHKCGNSESTCSGNCSVYDHFPDSDSTAEKFAAARKNVCGRQRSTAKRTKNGSCWRPAPPNQHPIFFQRHSSSVQKPSLASEASMLPRMSPLSDTHNASLLFNVGTLLELV